MPWDGNGPLNPTSLRVSAFSLVGWSVFGLRSSGLGVVFYRGQDFCSQDMDSSCSGQQRHASTLDQGQREVRSILGALILSQLRSVWHSQTAQVQGEQVGQVSFGVLCWYRCFVGDVAVVVCKVAVVVVVVVESS